MATGTVKRRDTEPAPELTINTPAGAAYNLTDHSAKFVMAVRSTLSAAMDISQTTIDLPTAIARTVEVNDQVLIETERVQIIAPLPTFPIAVAEASFNCTRGYTVPATAGQIIGSIDADTDYQLDANATFDVIVDALAEVSVTVTSASTSTNTTLAELVIDVQAGIDTATAALTVSSVNGKLVFTSDTTGAASRVIVSNPNANCSTELGIIASSGYGAASLVTTAEAHPVEELAIILKIENTAIIKNPPTGGIITYEFVTGDTDQIGTFTMEFEVTALSGRTFTAPNDNSFTLEVIADLNDRVID